MSELKQHTHVREDGTVYTHTHTDENGEVSPHIHRDGAEMIDSHAVPRGSGHSHQDENDHAHTDETVHTHTHTDGTVHTHTHADGSVHTHSPSHTHTHENTKAVLNRISRAIGHLESIKRMIEDGRDCSEVLIQLSAVKSAINNTGKVILQDHIQHCLVDAIESGDMEAVQELNKAIDRFIK